MTVDRSLIVPMFNESVRIEASLRALAASPLNAPDTELLLVDDGSTDDTVAVATAVVAELGLGGRIIRLPRNVGKGGAVQAGVAEARGAAVAFVDADLSAPPDAVVTCFEHIEAGKADVVATTRVHPEAVITDLPPATRRYGGKIYNTLLRVLGLTELADTQCGLKAFTADAARRLFGDLRVQGFAFDVEILRRAAQDGLTVLELPIEWHHVEASRVRPVRDGARMAVDAVRIRLQGPAGAPAVAPGAPSMDDDRFPLMARLERDHWWFRAKRSLVVQELEQRAVIAGAAADLGCGTGAMAGDLLAAGFDPVVGTDLSPQALVLAAEANAGAWATSRAEDLPFAEGSFAVVTSLDVIEHLDDDVVGLREYRRVLASGGRVLVAVPAYAWAWSDHDVTLGHRRRYTKRSLRRAVEAAGFTVERVTYFHSWLVPPALLLRRTPLGRLLKGSAEEASFMSPRVNAFLARISSAERRLLGRVDLPFGLSVLAVARR
jgi:SAM-dependent methyltransferase